MNERTLTALRASIVKWTEIADGKRENKGGLDCALCQEFNPNFSDTGEHDCTGCPVAHATGQPFCKGSPFERYEAREDQLDGWPLTDPELLAIAAEERDFLISLLPKEPG